MRDNTGVSSFKAIELDRTRGTPTGRTHLLEGRGRDDAIANLLESLGVAAAAARVDPSRTLVDVGTSLWTLVQRPTAEPPPAPPGLRRAAAKHRHVR